MANTSILYRETDQLPDLNIVKMPEYFPDLNLDQVINSIVAIRPRYTLDYFFYLPLVDIATIKYRQAVFMDLENPKTLQIIKQFTEKIEQVRIYLEMERKLYYKYHKESWFLEAAIAYCEAIDFAVTELGNGSVNSEGLSSIIEHIRVYAKSNEFEMLKVEAKALKNQLSSIQYAILINGNTVKVRKYESEADYSTEVENTFAKFKQGVSKNYRIDLITTSGMNHIQKQIIDFVAKLFPDVFGTLDRFYEDHTQFMDEVITVFEHQVQFYISYLDYIEGLKKQGLFFSYPEISIKSKNVKAEKTFDIALAKKNINESLKIVCNDFHLNGKERIIVVTGPNQGGKTTFARMFGQLHFLASLGCPVPGKKVQLILFDQIFTHFETEEDIRNLRGKLQDDLVRIHRILEFATSKSIIILNEIFTSTALNDAIFLSKNILTRIIHLGSLCVCVTFIDELSIMGEQTVSMVSTVIPENPAIRTFQIIRKPADGLSYALSIAEKHHLTYTKIKERIHS